MPLTPDNNCFEYSENPEALKVLLKDLEVSYKFLKYDKYFTDDKEARNIYEITLKRKSDKSIVKFTYGDSLVNTSKNIKPTLYDILTICQADYYIYEDFTDFCNEYGYDEYDRKTLSLFKRCLKQSEKLHKIFTDDEIEYLPR